MCDVRVAGLDEVWQVRPGLYRSSLHGARQSGVLGELGIEVLVSLVTRGQWIRRGLDGWDPQPQPDTWVIADVPDDVVSPFPIEEWRRAVEAIVSAHESGSPCLVHCSAGRSRSGVALEWHSRESTASRWTRRSGNSRQMGSGEAHILVCSPPSPREPDEGVEIEHPTKRVRTVPGGPPGIAFARGACLWSTLHPEQEVEPRPITDAPTRTNFYGTSSATHSVLSTSARCGTRLTKSSTRTTPSSTAGSTTLPRTSVPRS